MYSFHTLYFKKKNRIRLGAGSGSERGHEVDDGVNYSPSLVRAQSHEKHVSIPPPHTRDHAGGNVELVTRHPGLVVCGGDERIGAMTKLLKHKDEFKV